MAKNDSFKIDDTILKNRKINTESLGIPGDVIDADDGETIHIEIGELDYDPGSGQWQERSSFTDEYGVETKDADYRVLPAEESTPAKKALPDKKAESPSGARSEWKYAEGAGNRQRRSGTRGDGRRNSGRDTGKKGEEKKPLPLYLQIIYGLVVLLALGASFVCPYRYLREKTSFISDAAEIVETEKLQKGTWCTLKSNSLDGVPVYAEAGKTAQIAFIPEGKCLELLDNVSVGGEDWAKIDYCGITAWLPAKQLHFISKEKVFIRPGSLVYMNSLTEWGIAAYEEPSPDAGVVAEGLVYGTEFTVETLEKGWAKVRHEGKTCWVNMYHMGSYGTPRWKVETLSRAQMINLREEPSEDVAVLCKIPENKKLTVLRFDQGWGLVEYEGYTGWVKLHYLTPVAE